VLLVVGSFLNPEEFLAEVDPAVHRLDQAFEPCLQAEKTSQETLLIGLAVEVRDALLALDNEVIALAVRDEAGDVPNRPSNKDQRLSTGMPVVSWPP
jgi:hypothetical protein